MTRNRWVTPEEAGDSNIARCLSVPYNFQPYVNWALEQLTFSDNWEELGTLTPQECADAMRDMLSTYYESVCDVAQVYKDNASWFWNEVTIISGNVLAITLTTTFIHQGFWAQTTSALNNEVSIEVLLRAGTYELLEIVRRNPANGRQTVYVDDVAQTGFIEHYNAGQQNNQHMTHTVIIPADGLHVLKFKMSSKHASSTGYDAAISWCKMRRTGA